MAPNGIFWGVSKIGFRLTQSPFLSSISLDGESLRVALLLLTTRQQIRSASAQLVRPAAAVADVECVDVTASID